MMPNGSIPRLVFTDVPPRVCMREGEPCAYAKNLPSLDAWRTRIKADISIPDWDPLFSAVKARLRASVAGQAGTTVRLRHDEKNIGDGTLACILECVDALDQLHATWIDELDQRRQLELELIEITAKLELVNSKLTCSSIAPLPPKHSPLRDGFSSIRDSWFKFRETRAK